AKGHIHPALRRKADTGLLADVTESSPVVEVELGYAIVVGDEEIRMTGAAQVRRGGRQRPTPTVDSQFRADFFESAVAEIVQQIFSAAIFRILEALGHDPGRGEMPEIDRL